MHQRQLSLVKVGKLGFSHQRVLESITLRFALLSTNKGALMTEDQNVNSDKKETLTSKLYKAAEKTTEFIKDNDDTVFCIIDKNKIKKIYSIKSKEYKNFLTFYLYQKHKKTINRKTMDDVLNNLEGRFSWLAGKEDVKARVSFTEESIEIDLGNDKWVSIRIDKTGWAIGPHKAKLFLTKSMYPLPEPISDKNKLVLIKDLFRLSDDDYKLIVGWLIGCFMPKGPYPILILQGEQGSGKSTLARVLRTIIDPSNTPTTSFPNKEQDLYIQARHNRILSYDNQRKLSNIHSDWLCRISTGGGYSNRKLYTDSDEIEMNYTRPIILNGIHSIASQSDLISRAIIINLTEISDSRMQEKDL